MIQNKIGRNDPCHCASGLKYKKCCLKSKQNESENRQLHLVQAGLKQKAREDLSQKVVFLKPNSETIKMSEVILEFADDMLRHADTRSEKKKAIDIACLAWNLALFKQRNSEEYENQLNAFLKQMGIKDKDDRNDMELLIGHLVDKKFNEYPMIDRLIVHYQVDLKKDELMLNVASTFSQAEVDELTNENDQHVEENLNKSFF